MVRVLILDDHAAFREPLRFMFEREPEFEVSGEAGNLEEARGMLEDVDVAVVDLNLPDGHGSEILPELRRRSPKALALVLTASADRAEYARAVEAGAAGVLHKSSRISEIISATRRLLVGEALLSPEETVELLRLYHQHQEQTREARESIGRLTPREREILQCLVQGLSDKEISDRLYVSVGTVRNHVASTLSKLRVHSRLQALVLAIQHGLVKPG